MPHNHHTHNHNYTAKVEKKPKSQAVISVEVSAETLLSHRPLAVEALQKEAVIDGFRKGHVPEKIIVERLGEMAILTEAAEITISHLYPHIIEDEKLDPIGAPEVAITKLAPENPLHFTVTVSLVPEVILPDFKTVAKKATTKKESLEVTEKELDEAVERVLRQKMAYERIQEKAAKRKEAEDAGLTLPTPETIEETDEDFAKLPIPALTDDVAKTLGKFETADEFKTELKKHIASEKEKDAQGKHRAAVTDAIIDASTIDLPEILVDSEIAQMFGEMESDISRAGLSIDDYLNHIQKSREDLKKEWAPMAEKRAKLQLVLNEIAKVENVTPEKEAVEREVGMIREQFKDADPERIQIYVESTLRNEAVMKMLETLS